MSDAGLNEGKSVPIGSKPRLSLLSSKQSGIRLNSEEYPDQHLAGLQTTNLDDYVNTTTNNNNIEPNLRLNNTNLSTNNSGFSRQLDTMAQSSESQSQQQAGDSQIQDDSNKMNITKEDLLRLLTMLRSELQSKEIALAAIKCEQLKRLINPVEISRSSLATTYTELQDRFKALDQNNNNSKNNVKDQAGPDVNNTTRGQSNSKQQNQGFDSMKVSFDEEHNRESLQMLNTLLELLDRHPLLALPRDSIYCLDYNCNELSTKNYLNLKIHHLDDLINQHRRYRFHMNERLRKSEERCLQVANELEEERRIKDEKFHPGFKIKSTLLKHIDDLTAALDKEKASKQALVMTLLNDLLDEREKNGKLAAKITDYELKLKTTSSRGICENEKLLSIEREVDDLSAQLKRQATLFTKEKSELTARLAELESENLNLKAKLGSIPAKAQGGSGQTSSTNSSPAGRSAAAIKSQVSAVNKIQEASSLKNAVIPNATKTSIINKSSPTSNETNITSRTTGLTNNMSLQATARQTPSNSGSPAINSRTSKPSNTKSLLGQHNEPPSTPPVRVPPLFKSASVTSTNQHARGNLKNTLGNGEASVTGSEHSVSLNRSSSTSITTNQSVTKPQVPAKPAQLLEHQRSSLS